MRVARRHWPAGAARSSRLALRPGALLLAALFLPDARAERLPFTRFATADGLPEGEVRVAIEDRRGFLWFGTSSGLARFDGTGFRAFAEADGIPAVTVGGLLDLPDGGLLVATAKGLYASYPTWGGFRSVSDPRTLRLRHWGNRLARDAAGRIWLATADGLWRIEGAGEAFELVRVSIPAWPSIASIASILPDRRGTLWVGVEGFYGPEEPEPSFWRLSPDGSAVEIRQPDGSRVFAASIVEDPDGRLWVGTTTGLFRLRGGGLDDGAVETLAPWPPEAPLRGPVSAVPRLGGGVWARGGFGLAEVDPEAGILRTILPRQGLAASGDHLILGDSSGAVWSLLYTGGVSRLARQGFTTFGAEDGLPEPRIRQLAEDRSGALAVASGAIGRLWVSRLQDGRFMSLRPPLPDEVTDTGWGWRQVVLEDHLGEWWIPSPRGIFRFSSPGRFEELATMSAARHYTTADGLPHHDVFRLFEDSRGDVWISTQNNGRQVAPVLSRWDRETDRIEAYGPEHGISNDTGAPNSFLETPRGDVWIGFGWGQVLRWRDGAFEHPLPEPGVGGLVCAMLLDRRGRLWLTASGVGLFRIDDPDAERPTFVKITTDDGLSNHDLSDLAQDDRGRIYVATWDGVDVLDETTGAVRHLGTADGLPHRSVIVARRGPDGALWFGTVDGLARLEPLAEVKPAPPTRVLLDGLVVAGIARPLAPWGESEVRGLVLSPGQRQLRVSFLAPSGMDSPVPVRFQYRLDVSREWSAPTEQPFVLFDNIAPGRYRFEVRAVQPGGKVSEAAVLSFRALAPVWRRPWFLAVAAGVLVALGTLAYRVRVRHLLALERQRMRIARDLHDEVGSGLGSIGLLADLATAHPDDSQLVRSLAGTIGSTATDLSTAMGDIVWSLRSGSVPLEEMGRRLTDRARSLFPDSGVATLTTELPDLSPGSRLSLPVARNVLLIGLEALHNAARHSGSRRVRLALAPLGDRWRLSVSDDGRGFDPARAAGAAGGMGLDSMRRRAQDVGADLHIESRDGSTCVSVVFDPVRRRPRLGRRATRD